MIDVPVRSTLDTVEVCHHCRRPLARDERGRLCYWQEMRPSQRDGWPVSVKVCRECRFKWPEEPDGNR